jgi:UDP-glucose 4-epimerase
MDHPVQTIQTNVMGCESVLKVALRYRVKVVVTSTSEVYGKGNSVPFREDDDVLLGPTSRRRWAYAASKMVDEFLAFSYFYEKKLPIVIVRLFNTVGPRQSSAYGMVIPRFVDQALKGEPLSVYGDGRQSRCFLHVNDAVAGLSSLADCPQAIGNVFNIGSVEEISIVNLAKIILDRVAALSGSPMRQSSEHFRFIPMEQAYQGGFEDMDRRLPDTGKIRSLTGWQPRYDLATILDDIIRSKIESDSQSNLRPVIADKMSIAP